MTPSSEPTNDLARLVREQPIAQWVHDRDDGRVLALSLLAEAWFGRSADQVVARPASELFAPSVRARVAAEGIDDGAPYDLWHATEGARPAVLHAIDLAWSGRPATLVVIAGQPESAELSEALRESRTAFRHMAENVPGALFRYIEEPHGLTRVHYMSPRCIDLWEVGPEVIERDASILWRMVHPDDLPGLVASVRQSAAELGPWLHEWRITTPSGRLKWLQGSGRPERVKDGPVVWNSLILDVTDRRLADAERERLREELQRAQRLEALGRLAGGVAHDFNNLLTVILGHAELVREAVADRPPAVADLEALVGAVERSAGIAGQLLAFSRRQVAPRGSVDLVAHLADATPLLERLAGPLLTLRVDLPDGALPVPLDASRLDQILTNLVANARDASSPGGEIAVVVERDGDRALLRVRDRGIGMTEAVQDRIFEPLFTTRQRGTGLGLATVRSVVDEVGGTIDVRSSPGQGAVFIVALPLAEDGGSTMGEAGGDASPHLDARVLVVDDEAPVRALVERALRRAGADVRTVARPADVAAVLSSWSPDLLLSDLAMPGESGLSLAARVRREHPGVRVLMMTGYVSDASLRQAIDGADEALLVKPFTIDQLVRAVAEALNGAR